MRTIAEALREMMPAFAPLRAVVAGIVEARGLFLAESVDARVDGPAFDQSAMDGYAVRAAEVSGAAEPSPARLPVVGESRAGGAWPSPLAEGSAMRIFTGAPLPAGADAVIAQEDATREGDIASFRFAPREGHHVRARGSDVRAGVPLLPRGHDVRPAGVALLASQGIGEVRVHRRPIVSILCSGDELRLLSEPDRPGSIVSSNLYALIAAIEEAGGIARALPTAPDDLDALTQSVAEECAAADLLVTTGGVSVGDYDPMRAAFERAGVAMRFWKIAIKPGKPLAYGLAGATPVVGLPGNPVSALVTFELFVRPGIRRMLGDPRPYPRLFDARLAHAHRHRTGRVELARGWLDRGEDRRVSLFADQGSAAAATAALADALVVLSAERADFAEGESVPVLATVDRVGTDVCPFE
jgi:molybdopterin molybdotransferase